MDIRISGHQVETGDAFRTRVTERMTGIADKYFARAIGANVTLAPGPHDNGFVCDIVAHVHQGLILKGSNRAPEANLAFEGAADRIEKQLRRYVRRLKDRNAATPTREAAAELNSTPAFDAGYTIFRDSQGEEEAADNPLIVAETRVDVPEASVSDAVMMMDLRNTTALLFKNTVTGQFNMVYRREDGNIGWVEPGARA